jgi:hypothetical protein
VAKDMVLTAGHCIFPHPTSGSVQIKRHDLNSTDGEEIEVKEFISHPSYDDYTKEFDYALLVLERATTQDIKLIRLNSDENFPAVGSVARVMGWGLIQNESKDNRTKTAIAMEVDVNVISNAECGARWADMNMTIEDFHICTFEHKAKAPVRVTLVRLSCHEFSLISKPSCSFILLLNLYQVVHSSFLVHLLSKMFRLALYHLVRNIAFKESWTCLLMYPIN